MLQAGQYRMAGIEYERLLFRTPGGEVADRALLKKSVALKLQSRFEDAYLNLLRANFFGPSDSLNNQLRYEAVVNAFLAKRYDDAYNQYLQFRYFSKDTLLVDQSSIFVILGLNASQRWDEAEKELSQLNDKYDLGLNVSQLYAPAHRPRIRNLKKQQLAIMLIPGIVLIREGEVAAGLLSVTLKAATAAWMYHEFISEFYLNTVAAGGMYYLFYSGSSESAVTAIKDNNERKLSEYNKKLTNSILKAVKSNQNLLYY